MKEIILLVSCVGARKPDVPSFKIYIYLAASGLRHGMRDLCCGTRCSMQASL